jgi:hypothetical protein
VVLDCFAGVGTGLVALKRLQINVAKVIHVEHDKVASHVYKTNHCHAYNSEVTEDGIEHVFLEQFEDLTANVKMFLQEHGPIDLVLGGPPCDDFSIVKANRIDFEEQHDHYLIQLAQFIRELQNLQNPHPLWFFVESTILKQHDVCAVRDAFGVKWGPIEFEAAFLSPIHRKRHYFFNFPLQSIDLQGPAAKSVPACCLENGFNIPAESEDIVVAKVCQLEKKTIVRNIKQSFLTYLVHPYFLCRHNASCPRPLETMTCGRLLLRTMRETNTVPTTVDL